MSAGQLVQNSFKDITVHLALHAHAKTIILLDSQLHIVSQRSICREQMLGYPVVCRAFTDNDTLIQPIPMFDTPPIEIQSFPGVITNLDLSF
jgi:hypothetical protein